MKPDFMCNACLMRESGHKHCAVEVCLICHILRTEIERRLTLEILFREVMAINAEFQVKE